MEIFFLFSLKKKSILSLVSTTLIYCPTLLIKKLSCNNFFIKMIHNIYIYKEKDYVQPKLHLIIAHIQMSRKYKVQKLFWYQNEYSLICIELILLTSRLDILFFHSYMMLYIHIHTYIHIYLFIYLLKEN